MAEARPLFSPPSEARRRAVVSLTPLIDVVFILLVFFMLASSFLDWRAIDLDVPGSQAASSAEDSGMLVVRLDGDRLMRGGIPVTLGMLEREIASYLAESAEPTVRLEIGSEVTLQRAIVVAEIVSAAGGQVSFVRAASTTP